MKFDQYEDQERLGKSGFQPFQSPYQDYRLYPSSVTPGIRLGMNIIKPASPGYMLVQLHGWHMSMPRPERRNVPIDSPYLILQVDMRGRAYSEGEQDCNGLELIDVYDAVKFVRREYAAYLRGADPVYLEGGSGGGGNVLAMIAKFPDLFAAATALCGISDYAAWYAQDRTGEFRDEMDIWIGCLPEQHKERYAARSGLQLAANVRTPLYMAHGDGDLRVPVSHSRLYSEEMRRLGKRKLIRYDELPGVGERRHFDHASEAQLQRIAMESERNRLDHIHRIVMPERGRLLVGGYVYTRLFQVRLETVDALASLDYDAETRQMRLMAAAPYRYQIVWRDGRVEDGVCET